MYITFVTVLYYYAQHVKCARFYTVDWVCMKRACFCGRVVLKTAGCLQHMFRTMAVHLHACMQSCSLFINGLVAHALHNAAVKL